MSDDAEDKKPEDEAADDETAEDTEESEGGEEDGGEDEKPKGKFDGKLKYIIIGVAALVLLGGGGAGLYFAGVFGGEKPHETQVALPGPPVYYEMQRITVDLKPSDRRMRPFIRVGLQAELQGESAKAAFVENEVKIMDLLQAHLRTVTAEELSGQEGTERLRADITTIINRVITPERAITVLYKDIMVR